MADLLVQFRIQATETVTGIATRVRRALGGISEAQNKAMSTFQLAGQMQLASQSVDKFASTARKAVLGPVAAFQEFEDAMQRVRAVSGNIADEEFSLLTEKAKELGATTRFTANQAAEGLQFLAIAGFSAREQMEAIGPVLQLAQAGATDLGQASDIASDLLGAFRLETGDMNRVADVLAKTFTSTNTTLESLFESMKLSAPLATDLGISMEELSAITGTLGSVGIKGSQAGTSLRMAFQKLLSPSEKATQIMKAMGVRVADAQGNARPFLDILQEIVTGMGKFNLGSAQRGAVLTELFGARATTAISSLIAQIPQVRELTKEIEKSGGTVAEVAKTMEDSGAGSARSLRSALESLAITMGTALGSEARNLTDLLVGVVRGITGWISEHPKLTKALAISVAVAAGLLSVLSLLLTVIGSLLAAKGVLILAGGFKGLALAVPGVTFAVKTLLPWLGVLATKLWAAITPALAAAAPFIAVGAAILGVATAIQQLVKVWDQLDFSEMLKGVGEVFSEDGVLGVLGQLFDPTTLVDSLSEDIGGLFGAETPGQGGAQPVDVGGTIRIEGPDGFRVVPETQGPVLLDADAGLATAGL